MKIKLYTICSGNAEYKDAATLKNQRIILSNRPNIEIKNIRDLYVLRSKYTYEYDKSLKSLFKEKLNTIILYNFLDQESLESPLIAYTNLNWYQKIRISWQFGKCWIQNSNNIMWFINIMVAILAVIFAAKAIR